MKNTNIVDVKKENTHSGPTTLVIEKRAIKMLNILKCENCELSIVLCDDSFIHTLNNQYRHKDKPTDVLSFPLATPPFKDAHLGDIVISIDTAQRQADDRKIELLQETTTLLIHGILHLVGYTHENDEDEDEMNQKTDQLLKLF